MRARARRIIAAYNLHASVPVCLEPLEDVFLVRHISMDGLGTVGSIMAPPSGWPATPTNRARILLDYGLGNKESRLTLAHEIGHGICHHVGNASSRMLGLEDKHEREAWMVASLLLIPERVIMEEREVSRIAAVCEVPEWLVELWPSTSG